jgi:hypothetical protein
MVRQLRLPIPLHQLNEQKSMRLPVLRYGIVLTALLFSMRLWSQTWVAGEEITISVWSYALIDTNHAPVTLSLIPPSPGAPAAQSSNSDLFVRISSVVPRYRSREITARISGGSVPSGTYLTLVSNPATTSNSGGDLGAPVSSPITLSATDKYLVTSISTCYTGTGFNDGYRMTFTWAPLNPSVNYSQIQADTYNITVTFTFTSIYN